MWTQAPWGRVLRCGPLLDIADHLFTARDLRLRDDRHEWTMVAEAMGVPANGVLLVGQVHGTGVAVARHDRTTAWTRPTADIIVSDDPSSAIGVRVADCVPVLLGDRRRHVVGAAHAGWRGTVQDAAGRAVRAMTAEFGSDPADLIAAIGPSLGPCCGEVGDEVVEAFRAAGHPVERWFSRYRSGRHHVDLWTSNSDQLSAAGIRAGNIHIARLCTRTHAETFHSYRADRDSAGRMLGVIRSRP